MTGSPAVGIGWWALVGALGGFAVLALLSIGVFVAPVVLVLAAVGLVSERLRPGWAPGLLLGASTAPLWLAWLNRAGPGTVCETTATSQSCAERLSPWPLLAVAALLAAAGLLLVRHTVRRTGRGGVQPGVPRPS